MSQSAFSGIDPVSIGSAALQGLTGAAQTIGGMIQAHRAQKGLDKLIAGYKPNQGIMDYYDKALARYSANPFQSALFNQAMQGAGRGLATGINALNNRGQVIGGISALTQGYNDAALKAAAAAEGQQGQQLSQLGNAASMKAQEEFKPFEMKYNQLAAKALGGTQIQNAGLENMFGAGTSLGNAALANKLYGDNTKSNYSTASTPNYARVSLGLPRTNLANNSFMNAGINTNRRTSILDYSDQQPIPIGATY